VAVSCKVGEEEIFICSLREGGQECVNLDLVLSSYSEFSLVHATSGKKGSGGGGGKGGGGASIHLAGYLMQDSEDSEEDEEDMEGIEGEGGCCDGTHDHAHHHHHHHGLQGRHCLLQGFALDLWCPGGGGVVVERTNGVYESGRENGVDDKNMLQINTTMGVEVVFVGVPRPSKARGGGGHGYKLTAVFCIGKSEECMPESLQ